MILGIISDTHGLLRPEAMRALNGVDAILHAGDIGAPDIIPALQAIAPVTAIRGNIDRDTWADALPEADEMVLNQRRIYMLHDVKTLNFDPAERGIAIVVSGHSHNPGFHTSGGVAYLNPGSAGPRRFRLPVTLARLDLSARIEPEILRLI